MFKAELMLVEKRKTEFDGKSFYKVVLSNGEGTFTASIQPEVYGTLQPLQVYVTSVNVREVKGNVKIEVTAMTAKKAS